MITKQTEKTNKCKVTITGRHHWESMMWSKFKRCMFCRMVNDK